MKPLRKLLTALALLLFACAGAGAHADPALWVAQTPTATVYLFGTIHMLPPGADWRYPALDAAIAASGKLYVEEDDDDPASMQTLVLQYGMDAGHPLSARLDATDQARLDDAATAAGVPGGGAALDVMKPWLAALTIAVAPIVKAGFDPASGADKRLESEFKAADKPVGAFETAGQQIRLLAGLAPTLQMDLLHSALDDYAKGPAQVRTLVDAWQSGNVAALDAAVNGNLLAHYPALYRVLLVDRNRDFADQIAELLQQPGTWFVAVGAGHLAGPDGVQTQLQKRGIATKRVR